MTSTISPDNYIFSKEGIRSPLPKAPFFKFATQPYKHQLACLANYGERKSFALLAEMGVGKTWIMINNFAYLAARKKVQDMLVIAPNGIQWNWVQNELPRHLPEQIRNKAIWAGYSGQLGMKAKKELNTFLQDTEHHRILCVNWDAVATAKGSDVIKSFMTRPCMVVLDESDYAKNPSSKRTKALASISEAAEYKRIMTGTPITNSPFDAYSQFNFLDPKILDCPSFIAFKQRHGVFLSSTNPLVMSLRTRGRGNVLIPAKSQDGRPIYKNLDDLTRRIEPYSFRALKKDCLDLPEKVYKRELVELTPKQVDAYKLIKECSVVILANTEVPLANKVSALTHLAQCTGNHYSPCLLSKLKAEEYLTSTNEDWLNSLDNNSLVIDSDKNPKLTRAVELTKEALANDASVIIWCRYKAEINDFVETFKVQGIPCVTYYGETSYQDRLAAIAAFQDKQVRVFIANQQSGGTGITLTAASVVIYYSNSFSLHDRLQSEDRCHRIGQKSAHVLYIDLLARNTIDELILDVLQNKLSIAEAITSFVSKV